MLSLERAKASYKGQPLKRLEDPRFLNGSALFIDDIKLPGMVHAAILRSIHAHAKIIRVNPSEAERLPGVLATLTGKDVKELTQSFNAGSNTNAFDEYCMGIDKAMFVGQAIGAAVATSKDVATDALDSFDVEYEPLAPVTDAETGSQPGASLLYDKAGTNVYWHNRLVYGEVDKAFQEADVVVAEELTLHRYSSTPIEKFGCIVDFDASSGKMAVWSNNSNSGSLAHQLSAALKVPETSIRVIMPDIGGSYGNKVSLQNTIITALLSMKVGRPVKYAETERESMMSLGQSNNGKFYVKAAATKDGIITALKTKEFWDEGASTLKAGAYARNKLSIATGCYRIQNLDVETYSVLTNKCPSAPNRAVGKPGMAFMLERIVDAVARKLGMDRAEIRFRNFIQPDEFPYTVPTGNVYDSGNYPELMKRALARIGYESLKAKQQALREEGRFLGIGIACAVQSSTHGRVEVKLLSPNAHLPPACEAATVKMAASGRVSLALGSPSTGQGLETTAAQIVADELGVQPSDVQMVTGYDSDVCPSTKFGGRFSNKFSCVDSGAILYAARNVRGKLLAIAAHKLGCSVEELELAQGRVWSKNSETSPLSIREISEMAHGDPRDLPPGIEPGLSNTSVYVSPYTKAPDQNKKFRSHVLFASSVHVAVVEVDVETGITKVLRYVVVEDCGNIINPLIVTGQLQGAVLHGISASLNEEFVYNNEGQLLTATFMDYLKPTVMEAPSIELDHLSTPSPFSPLGTKGVGESGAIPPPAALSSAVEDALAPLGVKVNRLPLSPENVHEMIASAREKGSGVRTNPKALG